MICKFLINMNLLIVFLNKIIWINMNNLFKNINPIYLYLISLTSFGLANYFHKIDSTLYYTTLVLGIIFCFLGFYKRLKNR